VNSLSSCLDPEDEEAWFAAHGEWIEEPAAWQSHEWQIRSSFAWPSWTQAAARMLDEAED